MASQESNGKFSYEILVIDDGSTDGTEETVEKIADNSPVAIRYSRTEGKGISHARNRGISESRGNWIAFFDQDQLADPTWLGELFAVVSETGAYVVDGARDLLLPREPLSYLSSVCRRALGEITADRLEPYKRRGRTCSCTGNVLLNRKVFEEVGEFSESLLQGGEDWDFFRRVKSAGFDIWFAPKALVHHVIPPERLTERFFKWRFLQVGVNFAYRDYREWGLAGTAFACIARIGQALLVNLPRLLWAYLTRDRASLLARKALLWKSVGYTRKTFLLIAPGLFPQEHFFDRFELRKEQEALTQNSNLT